MAAQPETRKVLIAADHAGFELKERLKKLLPSINFEDLGPSDAARVDYPDFAAKLAHRIAADPSLLGILICGSGIGMSMTANRVKGVRAALVENTVAARLSREHNDANVLCLGARFLAPEYASEIALTFIETGFSNDARHLARIQKIEKANP